MSELYKELGLSNYCDNYPYQDLRNHISNRFFQVQELYNQGIISKEHARKLLEFK